MHGSVCVRARVGRPRTLNQPLDNVPLILPDNGIGKPIQPTIVLGLVLWLRDYLDGIGNSRHGCKPNLGLLSPPQRLNMRTATTQQGHEAGLPSALII